MCDHPAGKDESDLHKICRSCLGRKGQMRSLFDACLDEMLRKVADIQVEISDGLPEFICFQCVLQVSRAFRFKQQCQSADATLRASIKRKLQDKSCVSPVNEKHPIETIKDSIVAVGSGDCFSLSQPSQELDGTGNHDSTSNNELSTDNIAETFEILNDHKTRNDFVMRDDLALSSQILEEYLEEDIEPKSKTVEILNPVKEVNTGNVEDTVTSEANNQLIGCEFACNVCPKTFTKRQSLRRHLKIHDPVKAHVCKECGMTFTESSNLTKHMKKHTGELRNVSGKPNLCTVCGKAFKWASSLSKHMNRHTKRKVLNCPHCPKFYLERQTLKLHLRTHTGEKPFVCNICEKSFTQMCNLEKHLRIHTGEKPYVCPICDKRFTQSSYIAIHMRSHTGEKPYMCVECGKCFAGSNTLAMHKRTHTGEKPYCCNICGNTFARLETATVHQRTHTGEKPHYCSICNRAFISSSLLSNHRRTHINCISNQDQEYNLTFSDSNSAKANTLVTSVKQNEDKIRPKSQLMQHRILVMDTTD